MSASASSPLSVGRWVGKRVAEPIHDVRLAARDIRHVSVPQAGVAAPRSSPLSLWGLSGAWQSGSAGECEEPWHGR